MSDNMQDPTPEIIDTPAPDAPFEVASAPAPEAAAPSHHPDSEARALDVTGAFEGGGVCGSFDGMGISLGCLQWNLGSGTLQPLLKSLYANEPATFRKCMTQPVEQLGGKIYDMTDDLLRACDMSNHDAVAWAVARQDAQHRLQPHWHAGFEALLAEPGTKHIETHFTRSYMKDAIQYMSDYHFTSDRALVLLFDICVQMGSIGGESHARYQAAVSADTPEKQKLLALAHAVAPQAGRWAADVLARKGTIASGSGYVHGGHFNVDSQFGVNDGPVAYAA